MKNPKSIQYVNNFLDSIAHRKGVVRRYNPDRSWFANLAAQSRAGSKIVRWDATPVWDDVRWALNRIFKGVAAEDLAVGTEGVGHYWIRMYGRQYSFSDLGMAAPVVIDRALAREARRNRLADLQSAITTWIDNNELTDEAVLAFARDFKLIGSQHIKMMRAKAEVGEEKDKEDENPVWGVLENSFAMFALFDSDPQ